MRRRQRMLQKNRLGQLETLETRTLLAGDLIAQWRADSLDGTLDDGATIENWADSVGSIATTTDGSPVLAKGAIGGRSAVRFDNSDGSDALVIDQNLSPLSLRDDFTVAVVFATSSQSLVGDNGDWFFNTGIVDGNSKAFGEDWGVTINAAGQLTAGIGGSFGQSKETIVSPAVNDGETHIAVWTRQAGNTKLYVDNAKVAEGTSGPTATRTRLTANIGGNASEAQLGFTGDIAEVRFYDGQLTDAEAATLHGELQSFYNNSRPVANDDVYQIPEDADFFSGAVISAANGVLKNDTDADGDTLKAVLLTQPTHAADFALNDEGGFTYSPEPNFFGTDTFTYAANDFRNSEPATVTIEVTPKYDPATAVADAYKSLAGQVLSVSAANGVLANDINPDAANLTAEVVTNVTSGALTLNADGSFNYNPQGFAGEMKFSYRIADGTGKSNTVDVTLVINTPPEAKNDTYSVNEDTGLLAGGNSGVTANDVDAEGDSLQTTLISDVTNGTLALAGDGTFTYTPNTNYNGPDSFTYQLSDGVDESNIATVNINVTPVNDPPSPTEDTYFGLLDETITVAAAQGVLANDTDIEGGTLTAVDVIQPAQGSVAMNADGSFVFTPAAGFTGVTTFRYRTSDGSATSAPTTVSIAINSLEQQQAIVINEIHSDPFNPTDLVEFVELYNNSDIPIDVSGWTLRNAIEFTFPVGSSLPARGYIVAGQDPEQIQTKLNATAVGPWIGRLSNKGDTIELWTSAGSQIDEVDYQLSFPWPTVGEGPSMQLINPNFENDIGGSWRSAEPTPGAVNSVLAPNAPPSARQVEHSPKQPLSGQPVVVTTKVTDIDGVASVVLHYQDVSPGDYISITDPRFSTQWTDIVMVDDGTNGDEAADDGIYTATIPGELQQHRHLMRYRITSTDSLGSSQLVPYADDLQPNFAFYTYDGVPEWTGAVSPGETEQVTFSSDLLNTIPVYQLITTRVSHLDSQFLPGAERRSGYAGSDYLWEGTMVYDGKVYDHIHYRARGGVWRYAMGKNMWKFDFNRGHRFQAKNDYGEEYSTEWDKLNFSAIIQQGDFRHRGEQGLFESVGFKLFNKAGTEAPNTHYVHFRIVADADENGEDQYNGDFQGMYLAIEQPDGNFLEEHDLPDGNFYKIEGNRPESTVNQGPYQVDDASDGRDFIRTFTGRNRPEPETWRETVDVEKFYGYQAISHAIHHYDTAFGKNFYYYSNPETGKWEIHPWDLDLTWANNMYGNENHEWNVQIAKNEGFNDYTHAENQALDDSSRTQFNHEYQNRTREILDLLFNTEQTGIMIDEMASFVYTPGETSFVDADRMRWDHDPDIANSRYNNSSKNGQNWRYYAEGDTDDYPGMIKILKDYVVTRTDWLNRNVLRNEDNIPHTPTLTYTGDATFPINGLTFSTTDFSSPIGATFTGMEWRIAEITDVNDPSYEPYAIMKRKYEIDAEWESGELETFSSTMTIPGDGLEAGKTYRVRVRMRDDDDIWSHWSEPLQFVSGIATPTDVLGSLRISEIHYNPAAPSSAELAAGFADNDDFEFIELVNVGNQPLDLSGVAFDTVDVDGDNQGINFSFAEGSITTLAPGATVLVVENMEAFAFRYGNALPVAGQYSGRLSNSGEAIGLFDFGTEVQKFSYADDWYPSTDGTGYSLEIVNTQGILDSWGTKEAWRASGAPGGTPGSVGEAGPIPGDSNGDGIFDSSDFVAVFQAGEYEDGIDGNSTFEEGDWNGDGDFNTADFVYVFQIGNYVRAAVPIDIRRLVASNLVVESLEEAESEVIVREINKIEVEKYERAAILEDVPIVDDVDVVDRLFAELPDEDLESDLM
ncbi:MAG: tandem-95 repeat protein [Planctomycetales bacterium]|nr:tandem-95 repeat protein [Planctomycetales bacterium]